jgi:hypothetical protein
MTFEEISQRYVNYVHTSFKQPTVVFDGYATPSTKDHEHFRRSSVPLSHFVAIRKDLRVPYSKDKYLSLQKNKANFVEFLSTYMSTVGIATIRCTGDADTTIVGTAISTARTNLGPTQVIADDTDIAVLLLYHWEETLDDIFVIQDLAQKSWSVKMLQSKIEGLKKHLLFIHAWSGTDTTSFIFGKGKATILKTLKKSVHFQNVSNIMTSTHSDQNEVGNASAAAFKILYGGSTDQTLANIRLVL